MKKIILSLMALAIILWSFPSHAEWGNNTLQQGLRWTSISTATTTVIKSSFCFLGNIIVTGGTAGQILVYASGTTVAPIVANFSSTNTPQTYIFNTNLTSGCTVVTGAATNLVVTWL
jgi:hypothetical protein